MEKKTKFKYTLIEGCCRGEIKRIKRSKGMKNYERRLMITAILLLPYGIGLFGVAGMLMVYSPIIDQWFVGWSDALLWLCVAIAIVTAIIYLVAGISGIMASRGKCSTKICKYMAITLIVITVIDVVISLFSVGITKKVSQFIVQMIILGIYLKAADEVY